MRVLLVASPGDHGYHNVIVLLSDRSINVQKLSILFAGAMALASIVGCSNQPLGPNDDMAPGAGGISGGSFGGSYGGASQGAYDDTSAGGSPSPSVAMGGSGGLTSGNAGASSGPSCVGQPVAWHTSTVSLQADAFWILADGQCYTSKNAVVQVHSDPGWPTYTTLELIWTELGREMRFFIYFKANTSNWWSEEMRTYDGQQPYSDWLYYYGGFFQSPIGQAFRGDVDLSNAAQDAIRGRLHLGGLTLTTTLKGG